MTTIYSRRAGRMIETRSGTESWRDQQPEKREPPMGLGLFILAWVLPMLAGGTAAILLLDWMLTELAR
jgi:hypothetical protein